MIKVENGKVELNGNGMHLLEDLSYAVSGMLEALVEVGLPADVAKRNIERAVKIGFEEIENKESDSMGGVLNELYETLGEILGKAGKDNGSK